MEFTVKIKIPDRLGQPFVWLALLYRRIRYGYPFRRIALSQDKYAIVDPEDYKRLNKHKWHTSGHKNIFYAVRSIVIGKNGKRRYIRMHREIINPPFPLFVDHINHNGLDNRKANLRAVTHAQNLWNRRKFKASSHSKYKGVDWARSAKRWRSRISVNGKRFNLGYFNSEIEGAKAYDEAAKKYHGEFAVLNFKS